MANNNSPLTSAPTDVDTWRILKKAFRTALLDRGLVIDENEVSLMTRFMMEYVEGSGLRIVPVKPTTEMQAAIRHALDKGKRMSIGWVKDRTKQRWRYLAAIASAPSWRRGYDEEKTQAEG